MQLSGEQQRFLLDLARQTIRAKLAESATARRELSQDDPALRQLAGCFVSLHEHETHRLRGCVGRIDAHDPLCDAVCDAALSVLKDPRFVDSPVTAGELPRLEIELTILSALSPAKNPLDFDLAEHGIYLTIGPRNGCFLPQVARETGWSREQLLDRLCAEKLELPPQAWKSAEAKLFTFKAEIIGPEPFDLTP